MEDWQDIRVYDEVGFDRKLRREEKEFLWEETAGGWITAEDLILSQLRDLVEGLKLPRRSRDVLRLRLEGYTLRETAVAMGISRQRTERIWKSLKDRLPASLEGMEAHMHRDQAAFYGWQEVLLGSMGKR